MNFAGKSSGSRQPIEIGLLLHARIAVVARCRGATLRPARDLVLAVERCAHLMHAERPVEVVLDVVFARPQQLERLRFALVEQRLAEQRGLGDEVVLETAAEAAARAIEADLDLVARHARDAADDLRRAARVLQRRDQQHLVLLDVDQRVRRLHRRVREKRHRVARLDGLARGLARLREIAVAAHARAGLVAGSEQFIGAAAQRIAGFGRPGRILPVDFQLLAALHRGPCARRDHGDAVRERPRDRLARFGPVDADHVLDAGDLARVGVVERIDLGIELRCACDHREQRVGAIRVDAELRLAGRDLARVDRARRLADDLEVLGLLEGPRFGRRIDLGRILDELRVREAATVGSDDEARFGVQLAGRAIPLRRCGEHEQPARGRAGLAQILPAVRDVVAAARTLRAVLVRRALVGVDVAVRQLFDADARPVDVEFFGDQHRQ